MVGVNYKPPICLDFCETFNDQLCESVSILVRILYHPWDPNAKMGTSDESVFVCNVRAKHRHSLHGHHPASCNRLKFSNHIGWGRVK